MISLNKNIKIKEKRKATKLKRSSQVCKSKELKIVSSKLSKSQYNHLNMLFVEAKWIYNFILSAQNKGLDVFSINYKNYPSIIHLDKDSKEISTELKFLSSQMRQDLFQYPKNNILKLSKAKKKGLKVGRLKFKSEVNSIPLRQYSSTYKFNFDNSTVRIQGLKASLKVRGLDQLQNLELANAFLVKKASGFYIKVTTYTNKKDKIKTGNCIGLDFGIKSAVTTSDGNKYSWNFEESRRLKVAQRKLQKKTKGSSNYFKAKKDLNLAYEKLMNLKKDAKNKFVSSLVKDNDFVFIQDENIAAWKNSGNRGWGKRIQHSIAGGIISCLKEKQETLVVDKWKKTTKICVNCGNEKEMKLEEREYICPKCGLSMDRDIHSANRILQEGLKLSSVPTDYRELKLVELATKLTMKQENARLQCA